MSFICLVGRLRGPRLSVVSDRASVVSDRASVVSDRLSVVSDWLSVVSESRKNFDEKGSSKSGTSFLLQCTPLPQIKTNKTGWSCTFSPFRQVVGATPASFQATSHCNEKSSSAIQTNKTGWSCIFSTFRQVVGATPASFQATSHYACAQSQPSHKHAHTTQTHIDSTSTNMKFSFFSFLAAVFSSPPSTPLFGESSSVMVRILCFSL